MPIRPSRSAASPGRLAVALATARVVIGAAALAAPVASLRFLGADTGTARRVGWLTRMTGARDAVLGTGALAADEGPARAAWVLGGALADAADAVIMLAALRSGRLRGIVPSAVAAGAVVAAAGGAGEALRLRR